MASDQITVTMSRVEALALAKIAYLGLKAAEAFDLIQNTSTAERGYKILDEAATRPRARSPETKKAPDAGAPRANSSQRTRRL